MADGTAGASRGASRGPDTGVVAPRATNTMRVQWADAIRQRFEGLPRKDAVEMASQRRVIEGFSQKVPHELAWESRTVALADVVNLPFTIHHVMFAKQFAGAQAEPDDFFFWVRLILDPYLGHATVFGVDPVLMSEAAGTTSMRALIILPVVSWTKEKYDNVSVSQALATDRNLCYDSSLADLVHARTMVAQNSRCSTLPRSSDWYASSKNAEIHPAALELLHEARSSIVHPTLELVNRLDTFSLIDIMKAKEKSYHIGRGFLRCSSNSVQENMRAILIDWMMEVSHEFLLGRETLHLAVTYVDRVFQVTSAILSAMSSSTLAKTCCDTLGSLWGQHSSMFNAALTCNVLDISRANVQLLGITAIALACKMEEVPVPTWNDFAKTTECVYNAEQIKVMETDILRILQWGLAPPTLPSYVGAYLQDLIVHSAESTVKPMEASEERVPPLSTPTSSGLSSSSTSSSTLSSSSSSSSSSSMSSDPFACVDFDKLTDSSALDDDFNVISQQQNALPGKDSRVKTQSQEACEDKSPNSLAGGSSLSSPSSSTSECTSYSSRLQSTTWTDMINHLMVTRFERIRPFRLHGPSVVACVEENVAGTRLREVMEDVLNDVPVLGNALVKDAQGMENLAPETFCSGWTDVANLDEAARLMNADPVELAKTLPFDLFVAPTCDEVHVLASGPMAIDAPAAAAASSPARPRSRLNGAPDSNTSSAAAEALSRTMRDSMSLYNRSVDIDTTPNLPPQERLPGRTDRYVATPSAYTAPYRYARVMELLDAALMDPDYVAIPRASLAAAAIGLVYPEAVAQQPHIYHRASLAPAYLFLARFLAMPFYGVSLPQAPFFSTHIPKNEAHTRQTHHPKMLAYVSYLLFSTEQPATSTPNSSSAGESTENGSNASTASSVEPINNDFVRATAAMYANSSRLDKWLTYGRIQAWNLAFGPTYS